MVEGKPGHVEHVLHFSVREADGAQLFERSIGDLAGRGFFASVQVKEAVIDYFCHLCRELLAHNGGAETQRNVLVELELNRFLFGEHAGKLAVFGKVVEVFHGPIIDKVLIPPMQEVKRTIITTSDGSQTIEIPQMEVTYHSRWGAMQESMHVFIKAGLYYFLQQEDRPKPLRIFEMGMGTGLNTLLTLAEAEKWQVQVQYTTIEPYPLTEEEWKLLDYGASEEQKEWFRKIHETPWGVAVAISDFFSLQKEQKELAQFFPVAPVHLIYYDAFAPKTQPLLWTQEAFEHLYRMLQPGGVLVTYCSKSVVRRALIAAGFAVQKIPGPKWKREMLRATRPGE